MLKSFLPFPFITGIDQKKRISHSDGFDCKLFFLQDIIANIEYGVLLSPLNI